MKDNEQQQLNNEDDSKVDEIKKKVIDSDNHSDKDEDVDVLQVNDEKDRDNEDEEDDYLFTPEQIELMTEEEFKEEFVNLREYIDGVFAQGRTVMEKEKIFDEFFTQIGLMAVEGSVVAQDYLGYIYKRGMSGGLLDENIETSMKWQILAAANGNKYSIRKLSLFLSYAYDEIVYTDDFDEIKIKNELDGDNYEAKLGKLICEAIVDDLNIDSMQLTKQKPSKIPYNAQSLRVFDAARNRAIPIVLKFLRS